MTINRRTAIGLTGLGVLASRLAIAQHQMHSLAAQPEDYKLQHFTPAEDRLIDAVTEAILPADEHSGGAHAAHVSYYIDLVVANNDPATQGRWREGLKTFAGFDKLAAKERAGLLDRMHASDDRFFGELRRMTMFAYYSSRLGLVEELGYQGNQALSGFPGCQG